MLSYARQEAAQHAIDLKKELVKQGFSVYLVSKAFYFKLYNNNLH